MDEMTSSTCGTPCTNSGPWIAGRRCTQREAYEVRPSPPGRSVIEALSSSVRRVSANRRSANGVIKDEEPGILRMAVAQALVPG